jgi:uncharacterized protein YbjT (DUF2867 family)
VGAEQMHAAVLHGTGQAPRYEVFPAPAAGEGEAAWKSVLWEGKVEPGQSVLVMGATGTSGRIAAQLAAVRGARVTAAGRNRRVLDDLLVRGAQTVIRADGGREDLADAVASAGPYDLVIDYLCGAPAEAVFDALSRLGRQAGGPERSLRPLTAGAETKSGHHQMRSSGKAATDLSRGLRAG